MATRIASHSHSIAIRSRMLYFLLRECFARLVRGSAPGERALRGGASLRNQALRPHLTVPAQVTGSPACSVRPSSLPSGV